MHHEAAAQFQLSGTPVEISLYGNGHINTTYLLVTDKGMRYIMQRINRHVFADVPALMRNITKVTGYLARKDGRIGRVLTLVPTLAGSMYHKDTDGEYWRIYDFIDGLCLEYAKNQREFQQSGIAYGNFQRQLLDFPAHTLTETIPHFHDTPNRYAQLRQALQMDVCDRAKEVEPELDFIWNREGEAGLLVDRLGAGELPLRVTHNDTKLNNVMLDKDTHEPLCVIDLDTVMPGLVANDFGDSIRFGASTGAEDERDLSKIELSIPYYNAYTEGFLRASGEDLTPAEIESLPFGAKLMTLECGIRFLTDYLSGDVYFRISRPQHNLDRCRTQLKLVRSMELHWDEMRKGVKRC